jgi:hypothetical protein
MLRIDVRPYQMGADFLDKGDFLQRTDLSAEGAILVRPDGFVCWRSRGADPDAAPTLAAVLSHILSQGPELREDAA